MSEQCPNCQSTRIGKKNYGKKAAGVVGASAGTYGGYISAASGGRVGASIGMAAGPVGATVGGIGGVLIGALLGGATGASAGVILGQVLDECVFDNYRCLECGYSFSSDLVPLGDLEKPVPEIIKENDHGSFN
jgi:DNA-directed RNA polymerase subunit RPC12/RpoP